MPNNKLPHFLHRLTHYFSSPHRLTIMFSIFAVPLILSALFTILHTFSLRPPALRPGSDNTLYVVSNNTFSSAIGTKDGNPQISYSVGESNVQFVLAGVNRVVGTKQDRNSILFPEVLPQTDLKYTTTTKGIKEELIIKEYNKNQPNTFLFDLRLNNIVPQRMTNNYISPTFKNNEGLYRFHFEKPFAFDASGNRTNNVHLHIQEDQQLPGYYSLKLIVDEVWLHDPDRTYPITIDPTIIHDTTTEFVAGTLNRLKDVSSSSTPISATGGTITYSGPYTVHTFTSSDTFTVTQGGEVEALVIGGGGGGGSTYNSAAAGGGGAGGYRHISNHLVSATSYAITVGNGGAADASGTASSFDTISAAGGGYGGNTTVDTAMNGGSGGSGGGGNGTSTSAGSGGVGNTPSTTPAQGYNGGSGRAASGSVNRGGGGGGGAGGIGQSSPSVGTGGSGGIGISNSISGTAAYYAGGGGGGSGNNTNHGTGGLGGGGTYNVAGTANTGGGGGAKAAGGSGVVIIRYPTLGTSSNPQLTTYYQELPTDPNTVALWHMNENTLNTCTGGSNDICDLSGNNLDGAFSGNTAFTIDSRLGASATFFDGVSGQITIPDNDKLSFTNKKFTIEAWVKRNGNPAAIEYIVLKGISVWEYSLRILTTGQVATVIWGSGSGTSIGAATSTQSITDGQWHHLAMVVDGSYSYIYIDGKLDGSVAVVGTLSNTTASLYIGDRSDVANSEFEGSIDEVRISNINRSPEEIKLSASRRPYAVYTSDVLDLGGTNSFVTAWNSLGWSEHGVTTGDGETVKSSTDLIAQWDFNETSGTTAVSGGSCGTSCNGTLTNFASTTSQDQAAGTGWTSANKRWGAGALMFDGANDYVGVPDSDYWAFGSSDFTIETWVKFSDLATHRAIIGQRQDATNFMGMYWNTNAKLYFHAIDAGVWKADYNFSWVPDINNWYHIVSVRSGSSFRMYLNGIEQSLTVTTAIGSNSIGNISGVLGIGLAETLYMKGIIDSTRIYSRALIPSEILSNYQAGQIELQTRVGSDASPNDGSWSAWSPTSGESVIDSMDNPLDYATPSASLFTGALIATSSASFPVYNGNKSLRINTGTSNSNTNLAGYWPLDETGGSDAYIKDYSGNVRNGTPTGTTTIQGYTKKARQFARASSEYIDLGSTSFVGSTTNNTLEAWVKLNSIGINQAIYGEGNSSGTHFYFFYVTSSNTLRFQMYNGSVSCSAVGTTALSTDRWYHVAAVRNGGNCYVYLNGVQNGTATGNPGALTLNSVRIGDLYNNGSHYYFNGIIDELRISTVSKSLEEIAEAYRAGRDHYITKTISSTDLSGKTTLPFYVAADRPGTYLQAMLGESAYANNQPDSNTVGLWHLDEQSGTGAYLKDSSGNNNHGTTTNTTPIQGKVGQSRSFVGNGYIDVGAIYPSTAGTIDLWMYPTTAGLNNRPITDTGGYMYLEFSAANTFRFTLNDGSGKVTPTATIVANKWYHVVGVWGDGGFMRLYVNGQLIGSTAAGSVSNVSNAVRIGGTTSVFFNGIIDEVRISNSVRTATEIRDAYEAGSRTHNVTIDFASSISHSDPLSSSTDLTLTLMATPSGTTNAGDNIYAGDKIIVKENYDGVEYLAQGLVDSVNVSTGATTVSSWDADSTFPSVGFGPNSSVFKWQREYWNIDGKVQDSSLDAITQFTLRLTDGNEARTVYLDDLKSSGGYLTTPTGSTISSDVGSRYMQYRAILSSFDEAVSATLSAVTIDYTINTAPAIPTLDAPADTATNQSLTPVLQTTATDADSDYIRYKFELCEDVSMTTNCSTYDQTISQTGWSSQNAQSSTAYTSGTTASYTLSTPLIAATTYYYRSYGIDPSGTNTWGSTQSAPYSFTTSAAPTSPSDLYTEGVTNPTSITDLTPEFSAIHHDPNADGAIAYEIEVNDNSSFTGTTMWASGQVAMTSLADGSRSSDVSYAGSSLAWSSTYYWRIRFTDSHNIVGSWSTTAWFILNFPPLVPVLDYPSDTATNLNLTPSLSTTSTDPNSDYLRYKIELCTDLAMTVSCQTFDQTSAQTGWSGQDAETSTAYLSGTAAIYTITSNLAPSTTFYWRSYATDPSGTNTWSSTQTSPFSFTTRKLNESFSCLITETVDDSSLTIDWTDRETIEDSYKLERSVDGSGFAPYQTLSANSTSYTDSSLNTGHTYQYRVAPYHDVSGFYADWCTTSTLSLIKGVFSFEDIIFR